MQTKPPAPATHSPPRRFRCVHGFALIALCALWYHLGHQARKGFTGPPPGALTDGSKLDLVFALDCTGSMGAYIDAAKDNVEAIVTRLVSTSGQKYDLRFGLVAYRDHPPEESSFVTTSFPFTQQPRAMRGVLAKLRARGGGDAPEAVAAALQAALDAEWRADATKVVILIGDQPPHGLAGGRGDRWPNGEPTGVDPFAVLDQLAQKGITIYSVVPGQDPHAMAFFGAAAQRTHGQAVHMASASSLADVVVGASVEEMDLERLLPDMGKLAAEVRAAAAANGRSASEAEVQRTVIKRLRASGATSRRTVIHAKLPEELVSIAKGAASITDAQAAYKNAEALHSHAAIARTTAHSAMLRSRGRRGGPRMRMADSASGGGAAVAAASSAAAPLRLPEVELKAEEALTEEAASRVYRRGRAKGAF